MAYIRKTILALSIAAAAQAAHATTIVVAGKDYQSVSGNHSQVTLTGGATREGDQDGVDFQGANVVGDVVNNANISVSGGVVDALEFDRSDDMNYTPTVITGSIINNGNLSANGPSALGLVLDGTEVLNLINKGTIKVVGGNDVGIEETVRGIDMADAKLRGNLENHGTIDVTYQNAEGIGAYSPSGSSIAGDVINAGTIKVTGADSRGIHLQQIAFGNDVTNSGTIAVVGDDSIGLRLDRTNYSSIQNTGILSATGVDSVGIKIRDSFGPQSALAGAGIVNSGIIAADGIGIEIDNAGTSSGVGGTSNPDNIYTVTQNAGLLKGGNLSISGNGQTNFNLNGGTVSGDMAGLKALNVNGKAAFDGSEIDAVMVDVQSGKLYLARLATNLTNDLTVRSLAALELRVSDSTDPTAPIASVSGVATFESGSKITVSSKAGDFKSLDGVEYTLVGASQIVDNGLTVTAGSALMQVKQFTVDGGKITAVVSGIDGAAAGNLVKSLGGTNNAVNAISPFTDSVLTQLDESDPLYQQYVNADEQTLARLAEQLTPDVNGGAVVAAQNAAGLASGATFERSRSVGANSGDVLQETGAWIKVLDADAEQGTRNSISGYDANSSGLIIGADGKVNDSTTLGVAYSFIKSDVDSDNGNSTDVDSHTITGYAGWENGPVNVNGSVSYGKSNNESKRHIGTTIAEGDYDSDLFALDVTAGYSIALDKNLIIEPMVAARYSNIQIDGFTEKGSSAALSTGDQRLEVAELGFGVRAEGSYALGNGTLKPQARLMAYHDFVQDETSTTSSYVLGGSTFVSSGAAPTKATYEGGLGLDYSMGNVTFGAAYDYTRKADFHADAFSLKARYDF